MAKNAYYTNQYISTTLASVGGIDDSATTGIILASVTNITTDKPGIACLSYTDPIDTSKAEWITYTSIDSGTKELQGVTRGQEDFSAKPHANGVTVAFPLSKSHINNLNDALIIDGVATNLVTGVISPSGTSSDSSTELVTKSYADGGLKDSLYRQAIINGGFTVNQRVYASNATLSAGAYGHDRWKAGASGGDYTFTQLAQSTQITIKTGKSLIQVIEDKNVVGGTYTLSWEGTAQARFGKDSATPSGVYASSPITITGQSAGTVMSVEFNEGTLGKVQLNTGSVALPFMPKSYEEELRACCRYWKIGQLLGIANTTSILAISSDFALNPLRTDVTTSNFKIYTTKANAIAEVAQQALTTPGVGDTNITQSSYIVNEVNGVIGLQLSGTPLIAGQAYSGYYVINQEL